MTSKIIFELNLDTIIICFFFRGNKVFLFLLIILEFHTINHKHPQFPALPGMCLTFGILHPAPSPKEFNSCCPYSHWIKVKLLVLACPLCNNWIFSQGILISCEELPLSILTIYRIKEVFLMTFSLDCYFWSNMGSGCSLKLSKSFLKSEFSFINAAAKI